MSDQQQTERVLDCMNCGFPNLLYRHCKIVCQNCGFMLDCSDLDVGNEVKQAQLRQQRQSMDTDRPTTP
jgi:transcription initiation factor TFIIIB Brf1 subunit/transcription initiation factor TFIIB